MNKVSVPVLKLAHSREARLIHGEEGENRALVMEGRSGSGTSGKVTLMCVQPGQIVDQRGQHSAPPQDCKMLCLCFW